MKIYIVTIEGNARWQRAFSSAAKARKWMKRFFKHHQFTVIAETKHGDEHSWITGFIVFESSPQFHGYYTMTALEVDADGVSF